MHIDPRTPPGQPLAAAKLRPGPARPEQATSRPVEPAAAAGAINRDTPATPAAPAPANAARPIGGLLDVFA